MLDVEEIPKEFGKPPIIPEPDIGPKFGLPWLLLDGAEKPLVWALLVKLF